MNNAKFYPKDRHRSIYKQRPRRRPRLREIDVMSKDELLIAIADRLPLIVVEDYGRRLTWVQIAPKGWEGFNRTVDYAEFKRLAEGLPPLRNSEHASGRQDTGEGGG